MMMRLLTTVCCILAVVVLYGCGSGYLSEFPPEQKDFVSVHVDGSSNPFGVAFTDKATFRDSTPGTGNILAASAIWGIDGYCGFSIPELSPSGLASKVSVADSLANCTLPSCCVYDMTYGDACNMNIDCKIDPTIPELATGTLIFTYDVYTAMQTNANDGVGSVSLIVDSDQWLDSTLHPRFNLVNASLDKSDCTDVADAFELKDDDPFFGGTYPDLTNTSILFRDTDTIGAVNPDLSGVAMCMLHFSVPTKYGLTGLMSGIEINETGQLIEAKMQMCDLQDEVGCDMSTLHTP